MQANAVKCTTNKRRSHRWCSDVHSDLVLVVDGFRCKRCDDTMPEANIDEYLVVDGVLATTPIIRSG